MTTTNNTTKRGGRKLVTRYSGERGTAHLAIAKGTMKARFGFLWFIATTGLNKGYALEIPMNELKYRGRYVDTLPASDFLTEDR